MMAQGLAELKEEVSAYVREIVRGLSSLLNNGKALGQHCRQLLDQVRTVAR